MSDLAEIECGLCGGTGEVEVRRSGTYATDCVPCPECVHRDSLEKTARAQSEIERLRGRVAELDEQKRKLKWKLAYQAMHHVRLHNRWVCGELEAPEEESIVNPFIYAETEVWWAIGDEADGFAKELEADEIEKAGGEK